jgi:orotate phosphoribosyltransferase
MTEALSYFEKCGSILKGHFLLSSGFHSNTYIQCAKVTENPEISEKLCKILADHFKGKKVDVVIGPAYGGIILSYILGRLLGVRAMFAERVEGKLQLRRGFEIKRGEKFLVCEDVVTTGGSAGEVIGLVRREGGEVIAVACLVNRSKTNPFDVELKEILKLTPPIYPPQDCPLCRDNIPLEKPGSRSIK